MADSGEWLEPIEGRHYGASGPELVVLHGGPGAPGAVIGPWRERHARSQFLEVLRRRITS
jgi:hypothetical protein